LGKVADMPHSFIRSTLGRIISQKIGVTTCRLYQFEAKMISNLAGWVVRVDYFRVDYPHVCVWFKRGFSSHNYHASGIFL